MIVDTLISILEDVSKCSIYRQGSFTEKDIYPDLFITFWENNSYDGNHYDNFKTNTIIYDFDVNVYGTNDDKVYNLIINIKKELIKNNFLVDGTGYDVESDEKTHIGRGINVKFVENYKGE